MPRGTRRSAIDKLPANEPVFVGPLGLEDDEQAEPRIHGGPRKAIHAYASEDLAWWSAELGRPLVPGFIGENLTTAGIDLNALHVDDELDLGDVRLRITEPRDPCAKLAARLGEPSLQKRFGRAARTGVYCSVVRTGLVRCGDLISVVRGPHAGPSIRTLVAAKYGVGPAA